MATYLNKKAMGPDDQGTATETTSFIFRLIAKFVLN